jgi:predicted nuclease with TOPRIM domain
MKVNALYIGFLTFLIIYLAHKIDKKDKLINDLKSPHSVQEHYTQVQLENAKMREQLRSLDQDNAILQNMLHQAKNELKELKNKNVEYEGTSTPYVNPWTSGHKNN